MHDRSGAPQRGVAACLLAGGGRTWATTDDASVMAGMLTEEFIGSSVRLAGGALLAG
jgi:hypothetical protein